MVAPRGVRGCSQGGAWLLPGGRAWLLPGGHAWQRGGMHGKGGHAWQRGACMVKGGCAWRKGGVHGERGMCGEGGCAWYAPPDPRDTAGHCEGGTHPTGMHSCLLKNNKLLNLIAQKENNES